MGLSPTRFDVEYDDLEMQGIHIKALSHLKSALAPTESNIYPANAGTDKDIEARPREDLWPLIYYDGHLFNTSVSALSHPRTRCSSTHMVLILAQNWSSHPAHMLLAERGILKLPSKQDRSCLSVCMRRLRPLEILWGTSGRSTGATSEWKVINIPHMTEVVDMTLISG